MKVRLTATGTRPLLMHNIRLASPLDSYTKELKRLNGKPSSKRTDEDRIEIAHVEWMGGLYHDGAREFGKSSTMQIGPYVPASWIFKSLVEGARLTKAGKKIERGVTVVEMEHPLIYKGPRDLGGLWGDGASEYIDIRTAKVGMARVDRCRPVFKEWAFEAELFADPSVIDVEELEEIAGNAGTLIGVGDYRMLYGRYTSKIERL